MPEIATTQPTPPHSPLPFPPPWRVEKTPGDEDETSQIWVKGNEPDSFWGTICGDLPHDLAAQIVTAVNCHAALVDALREMNALVERMQAIVLQRLLPDGGVSESEALNSLIFETDNPAQHAAQQKAHAALALVERGGQPE